MKLLSPYQLKKLKKNQLLQYCIDATQRIYELEHDAEKWEQFQTLLCLPALFKKVKELEIDIGNLEDPHYD